MTPLTQRLIVLLRVVLGWFFFYAGITKLLDVSWSAASYLASAKTVPSFYHWLASPSVLPTVDLLNKWGLTLLGLSLILGLFVRVSAILGSALMFLYYLVILDFPHPDAHSFLVDQHIIYICVLWMLTAVNAGRWYGCDRYFGKKKPSYR